jgi:antitoxin (DNA-binding transcriptional repressor) of toxin-antitoxin stability system
MKYATIAELRNRLSSYLREVQAGDRILIRRRNQVIAELRPLPTPGPGDVLMDPIEDRLLGLARDEFLTRGSDRWPAWSRGPIPGPQAPVLRALLDERERGR